MIQAINLRSLLAHKINNLTKRRAKPKRRQLNLSNPSKVKNRMKKVKLRKKTNQKKNPKEANEKPSPNLPQRCRVKQNPPLRAKVRPNREKQLIVIKKAEIAKKKKVK